MADCWTRREKGPLRAPEDQNEPDPEEKFTDSHLVCSRPVEVIDSDWTRFRSSTRFPVWNTAIPKSISSLAWWNVVSYISGNSETWLGNSFGDRENKTRRGSKSVEKTRNGRCFGGGIPAVTARRECCESLRSAGPVSRQATKAFTIWARSLIVDELRNLSS